VLESGSALFSGCLQNSGVLATTMPVNSPAASLRIPVPSSAKSFAIVSKVADFAHLVGVTQVVAPDGDLLFRESNAFSDFFANPIRYRRDMKISTMIIPNSEKFNVETGVYKVDIKASLPPFGLGTAIPRVSVLYKMSESKVLDLHFYFLDLSHHPCREKFDNGVLDAGEAARSASFQSDYLGEIKRIFAQATIPIGNVDYHDISRPDLDGIGNQAKLRELFALAQNKEGIAIFLVRSLEESGVQATQISIPGPPRTPQSASSGVAVSINTLCYRSWTDLARVSAHAIAAQMGLWDNRDPQGTPDPIGDSSIGSENLMFFSEFGGTELSPGQSVVLGLYPGLR